ncbi:hypothetical protein [Kutzneria buriramensis]|nr:hypothetical protein [Kutzneria buriramensis]
MTDESDPTSSGSDPCDGSDDTGFTHPPHECGWLSAAGGPAMPWLVVYGPGTASEEVAVTIEQTCAVRCVRARLHTLDEALTISIKRYTGLVLVLPSAPPPRGQDPRWKDYRTLAEDFRNRNLPAAEGFFPRSTCWHEVGVLQVVYPEDALADPAVTDLIKDACDRHPFSEGVPFTGDVFRIFQPGMAQIVRNDEVAAALSDNWRVLRAWGISDIPKARVIKTGVDNRRDELDHDPKKPTLHRPILGLDMNRLDLLLFRPEETPLPDPNSTAEEQKKAAENFRASGARVVRKLVEELVRDNPWFHCPQGKAGKNYAQDRFADLYRILRTVLSLS